MPACIRCMCLSLLCTDETTLWAHLCDCLHYRFGTRAPLTEAQHPAVLNMCVMVGETTKQTAVVQDPVSRARSTTRTHSERNRTAGSECVAQHATQEAVRVWDELEQSHKGLAGSLAKRNPGSTSSTCASAAKREQNMRRRRGGNSFCRKRHLHLCGTRSSRWWSVSHRVKQ